jgi:hypothetical protein
VVGQSQPARRCKEIAGIDREIRLEQRGVGGFVRFYKRDTCRCGPKRMVQDQAMAAYARGGRAEGSDQMKYSKEIEEGAIVSRTREGMEKKRVDCSPPWWVVKWSSNAHGRRW